MKNDKLIKNHILHLCAASLIACAGAASNARGADETTPKAAEETAPKDAAKLTLDENPAHPDYYPFSVGIGGGTEGLFGGFAEWRFSDHMGVRASGGYTRWSMNDTAVAGIKYDLKITLAGEPISFTVYPWKRSSWHLSIGWLFNQNELSGTALNTGILVIDGEPVPISRVGAISMKVEQQPINPYFGIGGNLLYFDRGHHVALGTEFGIIYTGAPKVTIDRVGTPSPVFDFAIKGVEGRLQNWAEQFEWFPLFTLKLSYSF